MSHHRGSGTWLEQRSRWRHSRSTSRGGRVARKFRSLAWQFSWFRVVKMRMIMFKRGVPKSPTFSSERPRQRATFGGTRAPCQGAIPSSWGLWLRRTSIGTDVDVVQAFDSRSHFLNWRMHVGHLCIVIVSDTVVDVAPQRQRETARAAPDGDVSPSIMSMWPGSITAPTLAASLHKLNHRHVRASPPACFVGGTNTGTLS